MKHMKFGVGASVRRKEDRALITGAGRYVGDLVPDGAARAVFVRAPVAHATFRLDGVDEARAMPGVLAIITAKDVAHLGTLPCVGQMPNADGSAVTVPPYPVLPADTIRHVGEALAMVVAETEDQAQNAAEAIMVDFEDKPCAVDLEGALAGDAALVWPELGSNVACFADHGDKDAADKAFDKADRVVEVSVVNNRIVTNYMEPRGAIGAFDPESGRYTLYTGTQGVMLVQPVLAGIFGVDKNKVHLITPDVGGGFGTKFFTYREYALTMFAAEKTGREVAWLSTRTEHFLADYQGRDHVSRAELALDSEGNFLAIRVDTIANLGAYLGQMAVYVALAGVGMAPGCYRTPAVYGRVRGVYTNTVPVDAYRGAGRPEAAYLVERLVDKAALELGISADEIRERNLIRPEEMPFTTPTGKVYDTGDFRQHMHAAMERAGWAEADARRAESEQAGRVRGLGMSTYIEACSGGGPEYGSVRLNEDGSATIVTGTQSSGQGHHTAFAQLASQALGIDPERITVIQGDTDKVPRGFGTGGSRSIPVGGTSVYKASERIAERIKAHAADRLEAAAADLELVDGMVRIAGTDRAVALEEILALMPEAERGDEEDWQPPAPTFPNGTHIAEVEVDPDTGHVALLRYTVVDDFGVVLNPQMLEGQIHGGVGQGVGQALLERTVHDENGQLLTASFMDYCLPRADDLPMVDFDMRNVPCATNAMGMKGSGEAGAIGACPAVVNAVCDALHRTTGKSHIDMPLTPEAVWRAFNG